jgi:hypothetical protein
VLVPWAGPTFSLLTTGDPDSVGCADHDWPGAQALGDHATLEFDLDVPAGAHTLRFYTYFLSKEYPKWIGSEFNDVYTGYITPQDSDGFEGEVLFDAFGNPITVNSALFAVTGGEALAGTCFESHGGTGWIAVGVPVVPSSRITLTFDIWDVSDGIYDSWAILDGFTFEEDEIEEPEVDPVPDVPLRIGFVSPKEGPIEGGGPVTIHGFGFTPTTEVIWNGSTLGNVTVTSSGEALRIADVPAHELAESIDIVIVRGTESVTLLNGYTYYNPAEGLPRPEIHAVTPGEVHPAGGTTITILGTGIDSSATARFVDEDGVAADADLVSVTDGPSGSQEVIVVTPEQPEGWADLVITNHGALSGIESVGFPILVTVDALRSEADLEVGGARGCTVGGAGAVPSLAVLLVPLGLRRRRQPSV